MPYNIKCCACKEQINHHGKFLTVTPTTLDENGNWKQVFYGKYNQYMICTKCFNSLKKE